MENNQSPSKKKLSSTKKEKLLRKLDYESLKNSTSFSRKSVLLDLEISPKSPSYLQATQRVLVSIKPRIPPIKTLYIAERNRFHSKKNSTKSGSRLGIGDHSSFTTNFSENGYNLLDSENSRDSDIKTGIEIGHHSSIDEQEESSISLSKDSHAQLLSLKVYKAFSKTSEKCYVNTQPQINMQMPITETHPSKKNKVDIATLMSANSSSSHSELPLSTTINKLNERIEILERKLLRQEMVFRSLNANLPLSSSCPSDEETKDRIMKATSGAARPGCSYIEQYSHIPETSAFQRHTHQTAPLSPSTATTLQKEHNSEQYGRDFTTYDGITARGRRQCASVPCKREDIPKMAAERVHKIRHKLNPVRDYRLMDTVHYLAQGEFAPRDDGIKLTPSREAVLSDIIYEDVCRTHWPNTRLSRRAHPERCSTRCELQRLIDNLLRERVAHVERRRRRHYRIVKLNHRHENCRSVGKTGDIIVASHKNKDTNDDKEITISNHNAASAMIAERRYEEQSPRRSHRSHDRFMFPVRRSRQDDNVPGPSYTSSRSPPNRETTCCYRTSNHLQTNKNVMPVQTKDEQHNLTSGSSVSTCKMQAKNPRLVVKKETSRRKYHNKEGPDLEHYILLPTLVVRTPSNVKRQKKFNELYHRILNGQLNNHETNPPPHAVEQNQNSQVTKDVGLNINMTLFSDSP